MSEKTRSAEIMKGILNQMSVVDRAKPENIEKAVKDSIEAADAAYKSDKLVYRIAIGVLGSLSIIAAIGSIILVSLDKTTPEVLVALGAAAVGALVGLFAPSPVSK